MTQGNNYGKCHNDDDLDDEKDVDKGGRDYRNDDFFYAWMVMVVSMILRSCRDDGTASREKGGDRIKYLNMSLTYRYDVPGTCIPIKINWYLYMPLDHVCKYIVIHTTPTLLQS